MAPNQKSSSSTGRRTREELKAALAEGGSVLLSDGRRVYEEKDLPSEAELAPGDPAAEAAATERLQGEIERLNAELSRLRSTSSSSTTAEGGQSGSSEPADAAGTAGSAAADTGDTPADTSGTDRDPHPTRPGGRAGR